MTYGLLIYPDDGGKPIDISSGSRFTTFCGIYSVRSNLISRRTARITVPDPVGNSKLYVVPINTADMTSGYTSLVPWFMAINTITISGNTIHINIEHNLDAAWWLNPPSWLDVSVSAFMVKNAENGMERYGISMRDSANYSEVNDVSVVGTCVFRSKIKLNPNWTVPLNIPNRESCTVFAHWSHPEICIHYDARTKTISGWRRLDEYRTTQNNVSVDVYVCVFSNGAPATPPKYGLAIFNRAGQCTFSSSNGPLIFKGEVIVPRVNEASSAPPGVNGMMVPLAPVGFYYLHQKIDNSNGRGHTFNAGIVMYNNRITSSLSKVIFPAYGNGNFRVLPYCSLVNTSLPVLDVSDYF